MARISGEWIVWALGGRTPRNFEANPAKWGVEGECRYFAGDDVPAPLRDAAERGDTFVAHNAAGFDAYALWRFTGLSPSWYDTLPCARAAGLPGSLDELGARLTGKGKDAAGQKIMKLLTRAKWSAMTESYEYPVGTSAAWDLLLRYNVRDVALLERVYEETCDYGEPDVLRVDFAVNSRGVCVDTSLADKLSAAWSHAEREACEEIERITQGVIKPQWVRSLEAMRAWAADMGVTLDSLDRATVQRLVESPEDVAEDADSDALATVVEVLKLRQIATSAAAGKLASLRDNTRDGRAVDMLVYCGAATGRWTGRGFQPQNMGRGDGAVDVERCLDALDSIGGDGIGPPGDEVVAALRSAHPDSPIRDVLSTLTRPVFQAPAWKQLLIADYNAIEARGVAWLAGDEKLLDAFRQGRDPYCEMASSVFGRPITKADERERFVGKTIVLGCGYGMSGSKYGVYCKMNGINLDALGISAAGCVKAYRDRHKAIRNFWYRLGDAALDVVSGKRREVEIGRVTLRMSGPQLLIALPSGRSIVYRNATVEDVVPAYCKLLGLPEVAKPSAVYTHPRGYRKSVYGGLLAENVTQAVCRDLLATALVRCEANGLPVVLHVHDEIVNEVPGDGADASLESLLAIMADPPPWAAGFPIGVEGFVSPRYVKSPFRGYVKRKR